MKAPVSSTWSFGSFGSEPRQACVVDVGELADVLCGLASDSNQCHRKIGELEHDEVLGALRGEDRPTRSAPRPPPAFCYPCPLARHHLRRRTLLSRKA